MLFTWKHVTKSNSWDHEILTKLLFILQSKANRIKQLCSFGIEKYLFSLPHQLLSFGNIFHYFNLLLTLLDCLIAFLDSLFWNLVFCKIFLCKMFSDLCVEKSSFKMRMQSWMTRNYTPEASFWKWSSDGSSNQWSNTWHIFFLLCSFSSETTKMQ